MSKRVMLLVGTAKGAFFFHSDERRERWRMSGPHLHGWEVFSLLGDNRHGPRIYAGTSHYVYGPTIRISEDFGESWREVASGPAYPPSGNGAGSETTGAREDDSTGTAGDGGAGESRPGEPDPSNGDGFRLQRIWQIVPGHASQPDTLYAGVQDAGLFVSHDRGETWSELSALTEHPTRPGWFPGAGGLCLHTILIDPDDPDRIWIAISAVGVFRSEDGGRSWKVRNNGLQQVPTGDPETEIARCVHKMVLDPHDSDTLYMQFHGGVYRSRDGADSWTPIENGLSGNFGFPICVTGSGALFVIPLESDEQRVVKDGRLRVYRSRNGGDEWEPLERGLPAEPQFVGVLRDAMTVDPLDPAGIYFGTTMGEIFHSADEGERWARLPAQLPRITSVRSWIVE